MLYVIVPISLLSETLKRMGGDILPIQQVIKYEGDNSTFVWKHPAEDFNTQSQLIVHGSQEAIFFLNGLKLIFCFRYIYIF